MTGTPPAGATGAGCPKMRYPTRRQARIAARQHRNPVPKLSAYRCRTCGWWHLTSQDTQRKTHFRQIGKW